MKVLLYVAGIVVAAHGAIHLLGFVAYWPLAAIPELPYKTALAGGRWEVGGAGMKIFALLWLIAALGFLLGTAGLFARQDWWRPLMWVIISFSTVLIALDWAPAFRGAVVNALIAIGLAASYLFPAGLWPH